MKTVLASIFALAVLGTSVASAAIVVVRHPHHRHQVCSFRHHHRVCRWVG